MMEASDNSMDFPIVILGAGGHAKVLIDALLASNREIVGCTDPCVTSRSMFGVPVLGDDNILERYGPKTVCLVNGIGSTKTTTRRMEIYAHYRAKGYSFAEVIHPSAIISPYARLGEGIQVMAGAVIQADCCIGDNVLINTGVVVEHDCIVEEHVHIAPGCTLSGAVVVGANVHIGTNAAVIQCVKIGRNSVIGAGCVVLHDVNAGATMVGNPAIEVMR